MVQDLFPMNWLLEAVNTCQVFNKPLKVSPLSKKISVEKSDLETHTDTDSKPTVKSGSIIYGQGKE